MKKIVLFFTILVAILSMAACKKEHFHTITGELIVVKEATCAAEGQAHVFCTECGEIVNTVSLPKTDVHTEMNVPLVESTCTHKGLTEGKKCSVCDKILVAQQDIPPKEHIEEIIPMVDATCTNTGLTEGKKCTVCGKILVSQQEIPLTTHTYDNEYDESCNECAYIRDTECEHNEIEIIKGYDSTCTSAGLSDGQKCKKCNEILISQTAIGVKPHTEVIDNAVEPTCISTGLTEGKHCSVCETILIAQNIVSKIGHTYASVITEPTFESQGYTTYTCECGDNYIGNYVPKLTCSEGLEYTLNEDGETYSLTGIGTCTDTDIVIPNVYDGKPVISIGSNAFAGNKSITSVTMSRGIKYIGIWAFYGCSSLSQVLLPEGLTTIGSNAFGGCSSLSQISLPDSITTIERNAFSYSSLNYNEYDNAYYIGNDENPYLVLLNVKSTSTESCTIHPTTKIIAGYAFQQCNNMTFIEIPDSVISIGNYAFQMCENLASVIIGNNVEYIGQWAFSSCKALSVIQIPANVENIDRFAFAYSESLSSIEVVEDNQHYRSINGSVYSKDGKKLIQYALGKIDSSFTIPEGVEIIGESSFAGCKSLTNVVIADSVNMIEHYAFGNCTSLTSMVIPDNVTSLGESVFYSCTGLNSVVIGNGVTNVPYETFSGCTSLVSVSLGKSITSIESYSFENCYSLKTVIIPDSVTNIDNGVFSDCSNLKYNQYDNALYLGNENNLYHVLIKPVNSEIVNCSVHNNTKVIVPLAFAGCTLLSSVNIPASVTNIDLAFFGCTSIMNIEVDENNQYYQSIDGNLYSKDGKTLLNYAAGKTNESFNVPDSVTMIYPYAFIGCLSLESVTLSSSITEIAYGMFRGCTSLTHINIPESVTHIYDYAFSGCVSLTNITIPNSVTYIGHEAFGNCTSLTKIVIPSSVTCLESQAFRACTSLKEIVLPNSLTTIRAYLFNDCTSLEKIVIPESITKIDEGAFSGCISLAEIRFNDNTSQWHSISKVSFWDSNTNNYTIYCTDGEIPKNN